jgi:hypothetical protein
MELLLPVLLGALAAAGAALARHAMPAIVGRPSRAAILPSRPEGRRERTRTAATRPAEGRRSGSGRVLHRVAAERPISDAAAARDRVPLDAARDALQPRRRPANVATILAKWEPDLPAADNRSSGLTARRAAAGRQDRSPLRDVEGHGQPRHSPVPTWPDGVAPGTRPRSDRSVANRGVRCVRGLRRGERSGRGVLWPLRPAAGDVTAAPSPLPISPAGSRHTAGRARDREPG